jgi:hypothetical protein
MFSLLAHLADFSPSHLTHLEERLSCAGLEEPVTLTVDRTNTGLVILSTGKLGNGVVDHAFPSLCIREPELQPLLDSHIDEFLAKSAERPAISRPREKSAKRVPAIH